MPMLHNEVFEPGDWVCEVWTSVYCLETKKNPAGVRHRWKYYTRPMHHIHPNVGYQFDFLAKNVKEAAKDARGPLRIRNRKTNDIIMAAVL